MVLKVVIIGGVAGGATAATRARRLDEHAEIILFERGEFISFANCGLPYYLGGAIKNRWALQVTTPDHLRDRFNIDVRTLQEVVIIDQESKEVEVVDHRTGSKYTESYDKLLLTPGAEPIRPPLEGIDLESIFSVRTIPDTLKIDSFITQENARSAVIIGGGFIGLEMAENLRFRGLEVTIIELLDQVIPPLDKEMANQVEDHLRAKGVRLHLRDGVRSFRKDEGNLGGGRDGKIVVTTNGSTEFTCDLVILCIGVRPEVSIARSAGLELGERGGIKVDQNMRTSDPNIFAVGDAVEVKDLITDVQSLIPLAGPANKQARIAADNIMGRDSTYNGAQGTAILKVFDLTIAVTGGNEKTLQRNGIPHLASFTESASHATYYPGAFMMSIKLIFSPDDGKVLGAQIIGGGGVDKRIDVLATAIRAGMTVFDLQDIELAYAPPYSSAKDPVNMAGYVAGNILNRDVSVVHWKDLEKLNIKQDGDIGSDKETATHRLLDVRDPIELRTIGSIEGAVNIPVNELRSRMDELDKEKAWIVFCAVGQRGYVACRILIQNGFRCMNLSGGYRMYQGTSLV